MRLSVTLALLCSVSVGLSALSAAEFAGGLPTPAGQSADKAPVKVALAKNGNVRYGPTQQAKVVITLPKGTEVELLGIAQSDKDWFVIRFPKEGRAWVHSKVLVALDGGKRWQVIEDKARARDDATLRGEIVAELAKGDILDDKNQTVGEWRAVSLPEARAYLHRSVLTMPGDLGQAVAESGRKSQEAQSVWQAAQATYERLYAEAKANPDRAASLNWKGLNDQLATVIRDHADTDVRMSAQRLREGINRVDLAALAVKKDMGETAPTTTATGAPVNGTQALAPTLLTVPTTPGTEPKVEAAPVTQAPAILPIPPKPKAAPVAEGLLIQSSQPKVGVEYVLQDGDGKIIALLKAKVGADVPFSEYYWRAVSVRGEVQMIEPAASGLERRLPLVLVDDIALSGR